jgi:hypothetical protein
MLSNINKEAIMLKRIVTISIISTLFGCNASLSPEQQAYADSLTTCQKIDGLLTSFNDGFKPLRAAQIQNKYSDSWAAKYHVVGNSCQIIIMGDGNTSYKCAKYYKEETPSRADYNTAVENIRECLGDQWSSTQSTQNDTLKSIFNSGSNQAEMIIRSGPTLAKFGDKWQTTFEVGGVLSQKKAKN